MKMVNSLLLSAAGLVAVSGAQAADLPVKAKPVEYVKVCSLYGAGFYYIPGTDICVKIGGYVRAEWSYGFGSSMTNGMWAGGDGQLDRIDPTGTAPVAADTVWRSRAYISMDSRQQTAYGTLRTYFNLGISGDNGVALSANRAFIQIAGFTAGLATSYFDHYSAAAIAYLTDASSDTGDGGQNVFAYTAQLGNGVSASVSAELPRRRIIGGVTTTAAGVPTTNFAIGSAATFNTTDYGKLTVPDLVASLRVDQAWGSAQVMGALHQVNAGYYTPAAVAGAGGTYSGHPNDKWGFAVGAGLRLNAPMIGPGDYFAVQFAYAQGAHKYVVNSQPFQPQAFNGNEIGYGLTADAILATTAAGTVGTGALELVTNWGVAAGYEHFWTPALRTSLHGSYVATRYNSNANNLICGAQANATVAGGISFTGAGTTGVTTCSNDWNMWQVGARTQWNVTKDFYMGVDVVYYHLDTASAGAIVNYGASGAQPGNLRTIADQDAVATRVRWHRDIVP